MSSKELLLRVAQLAFREGKGKAQIAAELKKAGWPVSDRKVQELIEEVGQLLLAEHERLEELDNKAIDIDLGVALRDKFPHLIAAKVIKTSPISTPRQYDSLLRRWGRVAAEYLDDFASAAEATDDDLYIGLGGGETVLEMVSNLPERRRSNAYFFPCALIGRGRTSNIDPVTPETNVTIAWSRSGRITRHMTVATVPPHESYTRDDIAKELEDVSGLDYVRPVLKYMADINVAIPGLGVIQAENTPHSSWLPDLVKIPSSTLMQEGAVGDMGYVFFDVQGRGRRAWNFYLTAGHQDGLDFYRRMVEKRQPVIVAAGPYKQSGVRAALVGRLFNVFITDAHTAQELLKT